MITPLELIILIHRSLVESLLMTGSDLCASAKPWDLQLQTVNVIYEEFYLQGDIEIKAGRVPVPIMNRSYLDQQALHQVDVDQHQHPCQGSCVDSTLIVHCSTHQGICVCV